MKKTLLILSLICLVCSETKASGDSKNIKELIILSTEPFDVPEDNKTDPIRSSRIVFGSTASAGQFPHYALIFINRPTTTVQCGAGLIGEEWALSADHCVRDAISIELRLGVINRNSYRQKVFASALARSTQTDISLIKLATKAKVTSYVKPALLPRNVDKNNLFAKQMATICGMGIENQKTNAVSTNLQYAELEVMVQKDCNAYYGNVDIRMLCAKSKVSYASTCPGDSGSPLIIKENGLTVIIGIVSFGAANGCDLGYPVGYARTSMQLDWINNYTKNSLRN